MFFWISVLGVFSCIPRSGIIGLKDRSIFNFLSYLHTTFHNGYISLHSHQHCKSMPALAVWWFIDDGHSDRCEMTSHGGFHLHCSDYCWCWASSHVSIGHLYVLFGEVSIQVLYLFLNFSFFFILNFVLYQFWILTLDQMYQWICYPILWLVFLFCWWSPLLYKNTLVWYNPICLFFLLFPLPREMYPVTYCHEQCLRFCCLCFLLWIFGLGSNI